MNKTAIKNFSIWARNKLISDIKYKAGLMGITEKGIAGALPQSAGGTEFYDIGTSEPYCISGKEIEQRRRLKEVIENKAADTDYATAYKYVIEEVAYTWFNRLIAVRFMEINDYLPGHIRALSSETGKMEPDLVTTPFDAELEFTSTEEERIIKLKQDNKIDELFRFLFIRQCNALNELLPALFEKTNDYTEILLNLSVIDQEGVVYRLVHDIPEEDFDVNRGGQVEIIGWLYQYYNTEQNELVYDGSYAKVKVTKELLPAATTIYTPDWAVRYMVENSLGKYWVEISKDYEISKKWNYYIQSYKRGDTVAYQENSIENIKLIDPCMGSGHILVYAFDIFMQIYESAGYSQREAAKAILENNIYGLDIDDRAFQIAYFAIMMKARQYNRRILDKDTRFNLYSVKESNGFNRNHLNYLGAGFDSNEKRSVIAELNLLLDTFIDAKEFGSILKCEKLNWKRLREYVNDVTDVKQMSFDSYGLEESVSRLLEIIELAEIITNQYQIVITNPPYLGSSRFNTKLDNYVKKYYLKEKSDLSMIMYRKALESFCAQNGFVAFITTSSWMFLSSFENIREYIIDNFTFSSLVDFGTELFEGKVGHNPIVSWIVQKAKKDDLFKAIRLVDYCYSRRNEKEQEFFNQQNHYLTSQQNFSLMPGSPIAYWLSENVFKLYEKGKTMESIAHPKVGMQTSNNDKYLRLWFEVDYTEFEGSSLKLKWIKYLKGGAYRKWYGNLDYLLHYNKNPEYILQQKNARVLDLDFLKKKKCTWTDLTSGMNSFRFAPNDTFYDISGHCFFPADDDQYWLLAYANSKIFAELKKVFNSTFHCQVGDVAKIVVPNLSLSTKETVNSLAKECVLCVKEDWDSYETSWEFKKNPLVCNVSLVENAFSLWSEECLERKKRLKRNEETLNQLFFNEFGLVDEYDCTIQEKELSYMRNANDEKDIKSLMSYAVGCMFGRYSLDYEGLVYAGGTFDSSKYSTFIPDVDGIIPITDEEYFEDDILGLFCAWLKKVFGEENLEENLDFIAKALGKKGNSSREIIRNYFLTDFYKDHCSTYSVTGSGKRPIYWLFDSGKQNGFKALIYLHRYTPDTIGNLRVDYLHRMQRVYESEMNRMQDMIDHSTNSREVAAASKRKEKLQKQLKECREYDEKISHLALDRIELDLDDGVKYNYRKIQTGRDGKFYEVLADSKSIMMDVKKYADFKK